jgi:hypothetical protein
MTCTLGTLGPRHAEIVPDAALGVVAFFLADHRDPPAAEAPDAGDGILGEFRSPASGVKSSISRLA